MRILKPLLTSWLTLLAISPSQLSAQESSCDLPLVVTRFVAASRTVELVPDLTAKDLTLTVGGSPSNVKNASVDAGSKRVVLILDASNRVSKQEWKLETEMALTLIEKARPVDRFALLLVGVDAPTGPLLPLGDVQAQLRKMGSSRPVTEANERIYDALLAAAKRLDPPEFGDVVFLFGHPDDSGSKASEEQIEELILRNRVRFYAMSFTDPLRGKLPPDFDPNKPLPKSAIPGGADDISHATGYFFSYHSVESLKFPGQLELLEGFLGDLYAGIAKPYRVTISLNTSGKTALDLTVVNGKERNIHQGDVHYPRFIYPCTSR